jgi:serine/threonine-protein phosphatase PP1 catalytic subunit
MSRRLDRILNLLLSASRDAPQPFVKLRESDLIWLCKEAINVLKNDPIVLELTAPLTVCGDLHGQFYDLLDFFRMAGSPPDISYLFLGDYVDRGRNSVETFSILLALKIKYPDKVWLIRGNHETPGISKLYGFFAECSTRYNQLMWERFTEVFGWLPLAAIVSKRIFCVHGGISPDLIDVRQLYDIQRPLDVPDQGMITDLLWADPCPGHMGFCESERGTAYTFGSDVVDEFIKAHDFDLICRAHQVVQIGFEFPFLPSQTCLTVFSAPDYCEEFGNIGALLVVDENLKCSFRFLVPRQKNFKFHFRPPTPNEY